MKEQYGFAASVAMSANHKYHERYNNDLFTRAVQDLSVETANALIDEALAICGSPYYRVSNRKWGAAAVEFLKLFAE